MKSDLSKAFLAIAIALLITVPGVFAQDTKQKKTAFEEETSIASAETETESKETEKKKKETDKATEGLSLVEMLNMKVRGMHPPSEGASRPPSKEITEGTV